MSKLNRVIKPGCPARQLIACLVFAAGVLSSAATPATASPETSRPSPAKVIAAIPADFPPTYFQDKNGKAAGFAVDVMNELARRSGLTVEYVFGNAWEDIQQMVISGQADLIPGLTIDEKRSKLFIFTDSIEFLPANLIVAKDNHSVKALSPGLLIGVMTGSAPHNRLKTDKTIQLRTYDSLQKMLFELLAGHVDGIITLTPNIMKLAIDAGVDDKIKAVGKPIVEAKRGIAVRPGDGELVTRLNRAINGFVGTDGYQQIYTKWYGNPKPYWTANRVAIAMGGAFAVLLAALAIVRYRTTTNMNRKLKEIIAERKQAEAELRESRKQLSLLLASTAEAIYGLDLNGLCTFANPSCVRMLGYSSHTDLLGKNMHNLIHHTHPNGTPFPAENCPLLEGIRHGQGCHVDDQLFWRFDGTSFNAEYWSYPIKEDEKLIGAVVTFLDITQRKQVENEITRLNAELEKRVRERTYQLEAANRELESFAYSVSHDLRAPLRHMSGFSRLLIEDYRDTLQANAADYLERIEQAGKKMNELIDSLLQLSRLSRAELNLQPVDLSRLATEVVSELKEATPERNIKVEIADGLSAMGDPVMMRVVLQNLLGNAWKYTRDTSPANIAFFAEGKGGEELFCIRDNGAGFDMAYADKLFGAFQRLHGSDFEGTGIGLATVQRIIHRHGGQIKAEAEPGRGATFCFTLG